MIVLAAIFVFTLLLGAITLSYQIYRLVVLDAESRGLKHPKLWGFFSLSGSNGGGGLLLYLIGRNKFLSNMNATQKLQFESRKKRAGISLCFLSVSAIALIFIALFQPPM